MATLHSWHFKITKPNPAAYGWGGLVIYIIAVDAALIKLKKHTLSTVFRDAMLHPKQRWMVSISWGLITAHLFTKNKYDPITKIGYWLADKQITEPEVID